MNKTKSTLGVFAAVLFVIACATAGQAQIQRSYVAGPGIGNDANAASPNFCNFPTPCRNFAAAYGVTNAGGEIVALSPVGYGGLTVTHSITIQAAPGQYAFIAVVPSSSGIVVSAGASDNVILRNIQFAGAPALGAGSVGVNHTSGKLLIEDCAFTGLATAIAVTNAKSDVVNCDITNNTVGIGTTGNGSDSNCQNPPFNGQWPGDGVTQVRVDRGNLSNNTTGILMNNPGSAHSSCFCTPVCSFPTPTPSINPNNNLVTVFLHSTDNSSAGITLNITGNPTFMTGSGASCTATPNLCTQPLQYGGTTNPK